MILGCEVTNGGREKSHAVKPAGMDWLNAEPPKLPVNCVLVWPGAPPGK